MKKKATPRFLPRAISVKDFLLQAWSVDEHRPACCPACDAPARQGGRLQIHGHGFRSRKALGPMLMAGVPSVETLKLRRYRCLACTAVFTVGPAVLLRGFLYTATAIAWALSLWAVDLVAVTKLRPLVSPHSSWSADRPRSWSSLTRWIERARAGLLWPVVEAISEPERRPAARRAVEILRGLGPPMLSDCERLHEGVIQAGCGRMN